MAAPPRVVIIGAGPSGLTLARLLQINDIDCVVYEADESRHTRNQGGTLDLHPKAGQRALKEAGLLDDFNKYARPEGAADKIIQSDGRILWDENSLTENLRPSEADEKPEIDRQQLRNILLDSVEPRRIQWNKKVTSVARDEQSPSKTVVRFSDGTEDRDIDLLVGADGAWSKVRPLVTDIKPFYSGITAVELWSLSVSEKNPWLSSFVGSGSCYMFDEGRAIMAQRMHDESIRVYAAVRQPEDWKDRCGIDWTNPNQARREVVEQCFNDCSPALKRAISETRDALIVRPLYMLPVGATWQHTAGVTLIGDSAHVMTPFGGVGVNVAMTDALVLGRALAEKRNGLIAKAFSDSHNINSAVRDYEQTMFKYARENAEKTADGLVNHFSSDGGAKRAQRYRDYYRKLTGKQLAADHFGYAA